MMVLSIGGTNSKTTYNGCDESSVYFEGFFSTDPDTCVPNECTPKTTAELQDLGYTADQADLDTKAGYGAIGCASGWEQTDPNAAPSIACRQHGGDFELSGCRRQEPGPDPCGECYNECHNFNDDESCYTNCDNTACAPTHAEVQEDCPQQVSDCEADSTCAAELGNMFSAWTTGARPRPTQSGLFNELAICMFTEGDDECEHEIRNCWFDDDCFQEVENSKTPSPGNANVEGMASCFFGQESCDAYACWLDDGCRYLEFELHEQLAPWECQDNCWDDYDYENHDDAVYDAATACMYACDHAYDRAYRNATAGVGPEARVLYELLDDCRLHMYNMTGPPEREDGDDGPPEW